MTDQIRKPEYGPMITALMHDTLQRLHRLPMMTTALIRGSAIGGGSELVTACDFRLMASDSKITFVHGKKGIVPGWGGGSFLVRLVGPEKAAIILLRGSPVRAEDAVRYGLATEVLKCSSSDDENVILEEGLSWLSSITSGPTATVRAAKQLISAARELPLNEAHVMEGQILSTVWGGPDHK